MLHIEGMGVLGSLCAWQCYAQQRPFTWHDTERPITAWPACTGAIYPSGDATDLRNYAIWHDWITEGRAPWHPALAPLTVTEQAAYWFSSKHPPHGGHYRIAVDLGPIRMASAPAYFLNAQTFVPATRAFFADYRLAGPPSTRPYAVMHGFAPGVCRGYMWGWTVRVHLHMDQRITSASAPCRPALYCREGRFHFAYAYCVPGEPYWYAGSDLIWQQRPKGLPVSPKYAAWAGRLVRLTGGLCQLQSCGATAVGWRPVPQQTQQVAWRGTDERVYVRPLWHSGVRHGPEAVSAALALCEDG